MKRIITLSAAFIMAATIPAFAQSTTQRFKTLEEGQIALQASIDSISGEINSFTKDFEDFKDEITADIDGLREKCSYNSNAKESPFTGVSVIKRYSEIAMGWACLILFVVFLPLLFIRLYKSHTEENKRRYDLVVDLVRSGVEIKPEIQDYITGEQRRSGRSIKSLNRKIEGADLVYCVRRLMWGIFIVLIGFLIALISNEEIPFLVFTGIGLVFIIQAAIRYLTSGSDKESSDNQTDANKA